MTYTIEETKLCSSLQESNSEFLCNVLTVQKLHE